MIHLVRDQFSGGDVWHQKNIKVKLPVIVKELGLSRHAYHRLREVVGKRYHPGRDKLTITSERFEHREENRKDCLRTLYALTEDARIDLELTCSLWDRLKAKSAEMQGALPATL